MSDWKLPEGWGVKTLVDVAQVVSGSTPSRENADYWHNGTIPWATPTDITKNGFRILHSTTDHITLKGLNSCGARLLPPGSILMTSRATLGKSKIAGMEVCTNQGFKSLVPNDSIDSCYLYYQMLLAKPRYSGLGIGSTFLEVNKKDTESFGIPYAPLPQQRKIARILTTVDNLIEKTEALISKYESIKQGMMHDLFTRGVDEHGHLRPTQEQAPHLYKQSELGWIPKEWETYTVGDRFSKRTERGKPGLPLMSITMDRGLVTRASVDRRVESNLPPEGHLLVRKGDIAYNIMRMWQGVLGSAKYDCLVSPAYIVLNPHEGVDTRFCEYLFSWKNSIAKFKQYSQGVVDDRLRLYFHDLVRIRIAMPTSIAEQEVIAERLSKLDLTVQETAASLTKLRTLNTGLMQDLLTGKVSVKPDEADEEAHNA